MANMTTGSREMTRLSVSLSIPKEELGALRAALMIASPRVLAELDSALEKEEQRKQLEAAEREVQMQRLEYAKQHYLTEKALKHAGELGRQEAEKDRAKFLLKNCTTV